MALGKPKQRGRDEIVAVDVGSRLTKAVHVRRDGSELVLLDYSVTETPAYEGRLSVATLSEHLRAVLRSLRTNCRRIVLTPGSSPVVLTHADLPALEVGDLRRMIRLSPKTYLQQDLPDHAFDCYYRRLGHEGDTTTFHRRKARLLVAGLQRRVVDELAEASRLANLELMGITPGAVALANAAALGRDPSHPEPLALLDVGATISTIGVVHQGRLALTRTLPLGADKFAAVLDPEPLGEERPGVSPEAMQIDFQKAILAFSREVDASVSFFSSQHERPVNQLLVSGGIARSQLVLQALESEMTISCEPWHPERHMRLEMPVERQKQLEFEGSQLPVAVGLAAGCLRQDSIQINLLAEDLARAEARKRDPIRRGLWMVAAIVAALAAWIASISVHVGATYREEATIRSEIDSLKRDSAESLENALQANTLRATSGALLAQATNRVLFAPVLNALQYVVPDQVQLHRADIIRSVARQEVKPAGIGPDGRRTPPESRMRETLSMTLMARNYGGIEAQEAFLNAIPAHPFFKEHLRDEQPVLLRSQSQTLVDVAFGDREYNLLVVECFFREEVRGP